MKQSQLQVVTFHKHATMLNPLFNYLNQNCLLVTKTLLLTNNQSSNNPNNQPAITLLYNQPRDQLTITFSLDQLDYPLVFKHKVFKHKSVTADLVATFINDDLIKTFTIIDQLIKLYQLAKAYCYENS